MTFSLYSQFIEAGKCENYTVRLGKVRIYHIYHVIEFYDENISRSID